MIGPDGFPLTWSHFVIGLSRIQQRRANDALRLAGAVSAAQASGEAGKSWWDLQRGIAEG